MIAQLDALVECGNTVILVEHDMRVVATSDWVIDISPGPGDVGGRIMASATPAEVAANRASHTATYLACAIGEAGAGAPTQTRADAAA